MSAATASRAVLRLRRAGGRRKGRTDPAERAEPLAARAAPVTPGDAPVPPVPVPPAPVLPASGPPVDVPVLPVPRGPRPNLSAPIGRLPLDDLDTLDTLGTGTRTRDAVGHGPAPSPGRRTALAPLPPIPAPHPLPLRQIHQRFRPHEPQYERRQQRQRGRRQHRHPELGDEERDQRDTQQQIGVGEQREPAHAVRPVPVRPPVAEEQRLDQKEVPRHAELVGQHLGRADSAARPPSARTARADSVRSR